MSKVFSWNETFLTRLPTVDQQHQRLVDLINELGSITMSREDGKIQEAYLEARNTLLEYALSHFRDEELLMRQHELDEDYVRAHILEHETFAHEATLLAVASGEEFSSERVGQLLNYLVNWLAYHILGMDHSMARQIVAIEQGRSAAAAFENERGHHRSGTEPLLEALKGLFTLVSERNRELREINQTLEERVKQRTKELERANHQLRYLAENDELTGLPNRRYAMNTLDLLWQKYEHENALLSILLMDADRFKAVNDTFGHAEGDQLLRTLATALRHNVRTSDVVCRLGGDEFVVICPATDRAGAAEVAQKLLANRVNYCNAQGTQCWDGSISIGIATSNHQMHNYNDLLKQADAVLYIAKARGGCQVVCAEDEPH